MKRYDVLDGMRGIAALCVMLMHATADSAHPLFQHAYIAVDFFFILSGFVIAHSYGPRTDMKFAEFLARRLIRLYPMFLIGLLIGVPILILATRMGYTNYTNDNIVSSVLCNFFYLPFLNHGDIVSKAGGTVHGSIFPANDPSWSLFFEIVANFFFFAIFCAGRRRLSALVAFCFLAIVAGGIALSLLDGKMGIVVAAGWNTQNVIAGFPRVFYGFGLGVLLYMLLGEGRFARIEAWVRRVRGGVYLLFAVTTLIFLVPNIPHGNSLYYLAMIVSAAPILVVFGALVPCDSQAMLSVAKYLGWLSYPIYCVHFPIVRAVEILHDSGYRFGVPPVVVSVAVSVAVAIAITRLYDEPLRAWLTRRLAGTVAWRSQPAERASASR